MAASTRKTADAPAADAVPAAAAAPESVAAPGAESQAPVAKETPSEAPAGEPAEPPTEPARLTFARPIAMVVAGVGVCEPGVVYPVPESRAASLCGGDEPLFTCAD